MIPRPDIMDGEFLGAPVNILRFIKSFLPSSLRVFAIISKQFLFPVKKMCPMI